MANEERAERYPGLLITVAVHFSPVANDAIAEFLRLAQIPGENHSEIEKFLRTQETDSNNLAVLKRPDQSIALLKIEGGEATLFSFLPNQSGGRNLVHETYIGKIYDATITQVHAIGNLADGSALKPERVEIAGSSRLTGMIDLTHYTNEERAALLDALRETALPRS